MERIDYLNTIEELEEFVATDEGKREQRAWYKLGGLYRSTERWGDALNAYAKCMEFGAHTAAKEASEAIRRILDCRFTDWMNP
jgi:hypothetical protein